MSDLVHRVGVKEVNSVVRDLKLEGVNETNRDAIVEAIDHTFGIDSVQYDDKTATFENGCALDDWLAAESEINAMYPLERLKT